MVKRNILKLKPKKKSGLSKGATRLVNLKHFGKEPLVEDYPTYSVYLDALNWYENTGHTHVEARLYLEDYFKFNDRKEDLANLKKVPNAWICKTAGWIARMMNRGTSFTEAQVARFESLLQEYCWKHIAEEKDNTVYVTKTQENIRELIGDLEEVIDLREDLEGVPFSFLEWFKEKEVPRSYMTDIQVYYLEHLEELTDAYEGKCPQLVEAYPNKDKLEYDILFVGELVADIERYSEETKVVREVKPRKPRFIAPEKKVRNLKFMASSEAYGVSSVLPTKIIGSSELWTFNVKNKILTVFRAADEKGLQVKGRAIINYDPDTSVSKRTGRKPDVYIKKVLEGGKVALRKIPDELKNTAALAHRINDSTILLRVL